MKLGYGAYTNYANNYASVLTKVDWVLALIAAALHLRLCLWIVSRAAVLEAHFVESFAFEGKKNLLV